MAKGKNNRYQKKEAKASLLKHGSKKLYTKGNIKHTAFETGKDLLIGVLGGGLIGAAIGKPSLLIGLGITGAGHYTDHHLLSLLGIGMMAANGFQKTSLAGMDGFTVAEMKDRMTAYKNNISTKFYLDKVIKKAGSLPAGSTNGFGDIQYFSVPDLSGALGAGYDKDLVTLERIQKQLEESGMKHMKANGQQFPETQGAVSGGVNGDELNDVADMNL